MLCSSQNNIEHIITLQTSGTLKKEKRIFFSKKEINSTIDFFSIGIKQFLKKNNNILIIMPSKKKYSIGNLIKESVIRIKANPLYVGENLNFKKIYKLLLNTHMIIGTPIKILALSRYAKILKFKGNIKNILLSADKVYPFVKKEIENNFKCNVFIHYGMTEFGLGGAVQCIKKDAMHYRLKDLYFEIINPINNKLLKNGNWGEIVVTTLTKKVMPLIRYKTGDYGRILNRKCKCNSSDNVLDSNILARIEEIKNRKKELISLKELDYIIFSFKNIIDYEAIINKNKKIIKLNIAILDNNNNTTKDKIYKKIISKFIILKKYKFIIKINNNYYKYPNFYNKTKRILKYL